MGKVRVYELAKDLGMNSKKLITVLRELNVDVKNHMSTMDEDVAKRILDMLTKGEKKPLEVQTDAADNSTEAVLEEAPVKKKVPVNKQVNKKNVKEGRKARKTAKLNQEKQITPEEVLLLEGRVTVGELAGRINKPVSDILQKLLELGIISNINQQLTEDQLEILAEMYKLILKSKQTLMKKNF